MKEWIAGLFFVTFLSYIFKMLVPNGKTSSFIAFITSIITVYYIALPIKKIVNTDTDFNYDITIDYDSSYYDEFFDNYRENYYFTMCKSKLKQHGIVIKKARFIFDDKISGNPLKKIEIYSDDLVINEENVHINIALVTVKTLCEFFNLAEECVVINEI